MRALLTSHNISTDNLAAAVASVHDLGSSVARDFIEEFGFSMTGRDAITAAIFAVDAIFRLPDDAPASKVGDYVRKRLAEAVKPVQTRLVMVGVPVLDTEEVSIVPVVEAGEQNAAPIKGKRGRKRGKSDFCKAVALIEASANKQRAALKELLIAKGINAKSVDVYLWRYNKGERD